MRLLLVLLLLLAPALPAGSQERSTRTLAGIVRDPAGSPVPNAPVRLIASGTRLASVTDREGRFIFEAPANHTATLVVEAEGFLQARRDIAPDAREDSIEIVLSLPALSEELTVTATRRATRLSDTAASVVVLTRGDLAASAAPALDEALRQIPGFTLFRRSGSRSANPTSQGVSLRGVGSSGASRAAVFDDGILLNDPFGGWIYWGRVPRASLERVEVLRGGGSDLYGNAAMGGVVSLVRRSFDSSATLDVEASYGSRRTPEGSLLLTGRQGSWGAMLSAESFRTDGYVLVAERERGRVDIAATSQHETVEATVERRTASSRVFLRGSFFEEARGNGTPLQENDTRIRQAAVGGEWPLARGDLSLRAYVSDQDYNQSFSAVAPDRASESLTRLQAVPTQAGGAALQWSRDLAASHWLVSGLEARWVDGKSREEVFSPGAPFEASGGTEESASFFVEDVYAPGTRWTVTASARLDHWRLREGHRTARFAAGHGPGEERVSFPDRDETAVSPRVSVLYGVTDDLTVAASYYRSFRAPTLNELYRPFRVGNVVTLANEGLEAERLSGAEAGTRLDLFDARIFARGSLFWMEVDDAIGNVTLSATPELVTRQRRNLGRTRSRGVELDVGARLGRFGKLTGGYLFVDATVQRNPGDRQLEGRAVPQVPRHQGTLTLQAFAPSLGTIALQFRFAGRQYEDDRNSLPLSSYTVLDAFASRQLGKALEVFLAVENVPGERYEIGRTPVRILGPPRLARAGFRLRLGG